MYILVRSAVSGSLIHCWCEYKMLRPLWKTMQQFLNMLNMELLYDEAILLLGIYPRELKAYVHTETCTWILVALFTMVKNWNNIDVHYFMNGYTNYGIAIGWNIIHP